MKSIKFLDKTYECPESWNEVKLKQQIEVSEIANQQKYVKMIALVAGYTGIPIETLKQAPIKEGERLMKELDFLKKDLPEDPIKEFELNGDKYYVADSITKMQWQEYVSNMTAIEMFNDNIWKVTPFLLATMAKREGETLDDFDIEKRAQFFEENIDVPTANRLRSFFLTNWRVSKFITQLSSPDQQQKILQNKIKELRSSINKLKKTRGGNLLIRLWIIILNKWICYLEKQWVKSFNLHPSKNSKKKWKTIFRKLLLKKQKRKSKT